MLWALCLWFLGLLVLVDVDGCVCCCVSGYGASRARVLLEGTGWRVIAFAGRSGFWVVARGHGQRLCCSDEIAAVLACRRKWPSCRFDYAEKICSDHYHFKVVLK